jgi:hypothetical protein
MPMQARGLVLQPGQLDLQLALVALSALGEDVEDEARAVGHWHAEMALQVALLRRAESLVEDHAMGTGGGHQRLDLVGLATAHKKRRIGRAPPRGHARHDRVAGRLRQQRQFVERGVEGVARAEVHAYQHGACHPRGRFDDGCWAARAAHADGQVQGGVQACSPGSLAWKFTARLGTTVEMACL